MSGESALSVMENAARAAGSLLRDAFEGQFTVKEKSPDDYVTNIDVESEEILSGILSREYPSFGFLGEEFGKTDTGSEWQWMVDPLDGTRNFVRGIPLYALSIGLARGGVPVLGLVYDPLRDEMFTGGGGQGARLNGEPIRPSEAGHLESCVVAMDFGKTAGVYQRSYEILGQVMDRFQSVRMTGVMALGIPYVVAGRTDIYFNLKASEWDIAGGIAMARDSGVLVTDLSGIETPIPLTGLVAANPAVHAEFLKAIS